MNRDAARNAYFGHLEFALASSALVLVVTNARREVEWVNSGYSELTGWTLDEVRGRNPRSFLHGAATSARSAAGLRTQLGNGVPVHGFEMLNYKKSGEPYWVSLDIHPIRDSNGAVSQYVALERDITQRKRAEHDGDAARRLRDDAYRVAKLATIRHDIATGLAHCSSEVFQCLGIARDSLVCSLAELARQVHPEDADLLRLRYEHAINHHSPFDMAFRVVTRSGALRRIFAWGDIGGWDDGRSAHFRLVLQDITALPGDSAASRPAGAADAPSNDRLDRASRAGHALRTPLHAVRGFAASIERAERAHLSERSLRYLGQIQDASALLLQAVDELLDLTQGRAGPAATAIERLDPLAVARAVRALVEPLAAERDVTVLVSERLPPLHVSGDRQRLTQVLLNLVSNAIRHTAARGRVDIHAEPGADGRVTIAVTDTGTGMREIDVARLFEPADRGSGPRAGHGGGLGLRIARDLARGMGGDIAVDSTPGVGSSFSVSLPRASGGAGPVADGAPAGTFARRASLHARATVLYIEDNDVNCLLVEACLEPREDLELVCASTGMAGLAVARRARPSIILVDINLPDMTGHEVVRQILADPDLHRTPCIALSADGERAAVEFALCTGFREYLAKPVAPDRLLDALDRHLAGREPPALH